MPRLASGVGHQPAVWLLFILRLQKCIRAEYLLIIFLLFIILSYFRPTDHENSYEEINHKFQSSNKKFTASYRNDHLLDKCNFDETESLLRYKPLKETNNSTSDDRPQPTVERLHKLFSILISHEDKYRQVFDYLSVFRFTDLYNTLLPFANNTGRLHEIYCLFQRYITVSDNGYIDITLHFIRYLKQVSSYLSDGFTTEHPTWKKTLVKDLRKPVIILAANGRFYDALQASMRTINQYFPNHSVVIYELGLNHNQLNMVRNSHVN